MTPTPTRATRALVIGESLIDVLVTEGPDGESVREMPGGSPMNTAIGLARQGVDVAFVTELGADQRADTIEQRLVAEGVDVYTAPRAGRTSTAEARIAANGAADYSFDLSWNLGEVPLPRGDADVVHFGSLGAALQPGSDTVDALVERYAAAATVTFDPNIRARVDRDPDAARQRVDRHAARSDIVKASDEDIAWLNPDEPLDAVIDRWLAGGTAIVVVTQAEAGIVIATADHRVRLSGRPVPVADTIGGGDAVTAGLIAALGTLGLLGAGHRDELRALDEATLHRVGAWAQRTAEITVTRAGAEPPTSLEMLERSAPGAPA